MIVEKTNARKGGTQDFVRFVRDGYRVMRGKEIKYTKSMGRGMDAVVHQPRPEANFSEFSVWDKEWELLAELVRESAQHDGPIVEIGVLAGRTTQRIATVKSPEQKILAVDNFCWNGWGLTPDEQFSLVQLSLGYLVETGHVEICRIDKDEFFRTYDGPTPSLVFLDAMHDYKETRKDIVWAKEVGAKIVCGHDYCDDFPGVIKAVKEFGGPTRLAERLYVL
ncbi:hypothetical protein Mal15_62950 [Stieleria maiorica]|uniref:Uncharacterized protein n=1 Tax=Stieleria maiorica TaxID=2795974 RepID=A0A5B9MPC8_9BACT|nr:class I SAM-dependent methyltransferase [Stieleria maiorica]QEG02210.1 hypothetical protein Mal15_62950 [Stieleria maiorica]